MAQQVNTTLVVNAVNGGVDDYLKKVEAQVDRISKKIANMGGQYSQALANVLDPSRSPASTKTAGAVFTQATEGMTRLMETQTTQMRTKGEEARKSVENTAERNRLAAARSMSLYGTTNVDAITKIQKAKAESALETHTKRTGAINERASAVINQTIAGEEARRLRQQKVQDTLGNWNAADLEQVGQRKLGIAGGFVSLAEQRADIRERNVKSAADKEQVAQLGATRRYNERGGTIREVIADRKDYLTAQTADRGATKAEYRKQLEEEKKAAHERRSQARMWRQQDRIEEKQHYSSQAAASGILGLLPGSGRLRQLGGLAAAMSPTAASGISSVSSAITNRLATPINMQAAIGPAPSTIAPNALGGAAPGAGGGFLVQAGMGRMLANVGLGMAGGAALATAGVVQLDRLATNKAKETFSPALGSLMNMENTLQSVNNAGGFQSVQEFLAQSYTQNLGRKGMRREEIAGATSQFLSARGRSTPQGDMGKFITSSRFFGTNYGAAGVAAGLGYSGRDYDRLQRNLYDAGIGKGAMMDQQRDMLMAADQRAAGLGLGRTGIAGANAAYAAQLGGQGYGGGQYGALQMVNKLQGIGNSPGDSIRASMGSMADMLVFAESVKRSGNLFGGIEGTSKMTAQEKHDILRQTSAGQIGMFGKEISYDAARGAVRGSPVVSPALEEFNNEYNRRQVTTENQVMDIGVAQGLIEGMQKLDNSLKLLDASMAKSLNFAAEQERIRFAASSATEMAPGLGWTFGLAGF